MDTFARLATSSIVDNEIPQGVPICFSSKRLVEALRQLYNNDFIEKVNRQSRKFKVDVWCDSLGGA